MDVPAPLTRLPPPLFHQPPDDEQPDNCRKIRDEAENAAFVNVVAHFCPPISAATMMKSIRAKFPKRRTERQCHEKKPFPRRLKCDETVNRGQQKNRDETPDAAARRGNFILVSA